MAKKSKIKVVKDKVKFITKTDIFAAVSMVSIIINIFFLTGFVYYKSTSRLDASVLDIAIDNFCYRRYEDNLDRAIKDSGDAQLSTTTFELTCQTGDFEPYYTDAVEQYLEAKGY